MREYPDSKKMAHGGTYLLGIDIGTSTVKAVLIEKGTFRVVQERQKKLGPHVQVDTISAHERSVDEIFSCLESCIGSFDPSLLQGVSSIGVCGQMHGSTLWKGAHPFFLEGQLRCSEAASCTNLVTWQDGRCSPNFLASLPQTRQAISVSGGYGCATLAWLQKFRPDVLWAYDRAGTIMDLVVFALCGGIGKVTMSAQNATSWGYFDIHRMEWESELLSGTDFPVHLLPEVVQAPYTAGYLQMKWHGIPEATPIGVAMGDLQCSIYAAQPTPTDAVLNIGSASQLAIVKPIRVHVQTSGKEDKIPPNQTPLPPSVIEVPYFNCDHLVVAAALAGGNVIASFVTMMYGWLDALGVQCQESDIYAKLISCAEEKPDTSLRIDPTLWGERYAPEARGSVSNIGPDNLTLGDASSAMFRGIVENLRRMMPPEIFQEHQIQRLLGSGQTLQRNPVLQHHTERVFGVPLVISDRPVDAPLGAAMAVQSLFSSSPEKQGRNKSTVCTVL